MTAEVTTPKPLLNTEEPICPKGESACADGTCLPTTLFCDGHADCYDHSDEGWCDPEHDPNAAPVCDYANVRKTEGIVTHTNFKIFNAFAPQFKIEPLQGVCCCCHLVTDALMAMEKNTHKKILMHIFSRLGIILKRNLPPLPSNYY